MRTAVVILTGVFAWTAPARADVLLHRQLPRRTVGYFADTQFYDDFGNKSSQLVADRFSLSQVNPVCRVIFWGFYGSSLDDYPQPPPSSELMNIRFFSSDNGLPGQVLFDESILNPSRVATGFTVATGPGPPEFVYTIELPDCFHAAANTDYWLEITQIGDVDSLFRWEGAINGEFAAQFPIGNPWRLISGIGQLAYELWTPEPATSLLISVAFAMRLSRRRRSRR